MIREPGVPPVAMDSRAAEGEIPHESLHRTTIARSGHRSGGRERPPSFRAPRTRLLVRRA